MGFQLPSPQLVSLPDFQLPSLASMRRQPLEACHARCEPGTLRARTTGSSTQPGGAVPAAGRWAPGR